MDVGELRAAFAASEAVGERLQRFRSERVARIIAGETPVLMPQSAKATLHLMPFSAARPGTLLDVRALRDNVPRMQPIGINGCGYRFNFDGVVTSSSGRDKDLCKSYCQLFRTGMVEATWAGLVKEWGGGRSIASEAFERDLIDAVRNYLGGLRNLGVPVPVSISLTFTGVQGSYLYVGPGMTAGRDVEIDRDVLFLPDVLGEQYEQDAARLMRPIFDAVWNAAGYEGSLNYDSDGKWKPS
jgi:hypothetical protein